MPIKTAVFVISAFCGLAARRSTGYLSTGYFASTYARSGLRYADSVVQDTLPPLHTIKGKNIVSVIPSFEEQTLTLVLKNGTSYIYKDKDWDFEDFYPSTDPRIVAAIRHMTRTFTKVEHPPEFPGGEDAWDKYIADFCSKYAEDIKKRGPAEVTVQFIVHLKGQVIDIQVVSTSNPSSLSALAVKAIHDGPGWVPAVQNGREVVSYKLQVVKLSL
jgi:hypothetical protein